MSSSSHPTTSSNQSLSDRVKDTYSTAKSAAGQLKKAAKEELNDFQDRAHLGGIKNQLRADSSNSASIGDVNPSLSQRVDRDAQL
jgi:K+-transporting ATPase c subunit